jgi:ubiquinone/menaquinone biosynthesis C-methylase UbiE
MNMHRHKLFYARRTQVNSADRYSLTSITRRDWNKIAHKVTFNLDIDIQRFIDLVPLETKTLDLGCGYGRITNDLVLCGYKNAVGIDPSFKMIERGTQTYPELSLSHMPVGELPYKNDTFGAVVTCAVFSCMISVKDRVKTVSEIHRVLRPSGVFHIAEFCSEHTKVFESDLGIRMRHSQPQELRDMLRSLEMISDQVIEAKTMSGKEALSFRAFARKIA